jgi:hypothetical protein
MPSRTWLKQTPRHGNAPGRLPVGNRCQPSRGRSQVGLLLRTGHPTRLRCVKQGSPADLFKTAGNPLMASAGRLCCKMASVVSTRERSPEMSMIGCRLRRGQVPDGWMIQHQKLPYLCPKFPRFIKGPYVRAGRSTVISDRA